MQPNSIVTTQLDHSRGIMPSRLPNLRSFGDRINSPGAVMDAQSGIEVGADRIQALLNFGHASGGWTYNNETIKKQRADGPDRGGHTDDENRGIPTKLARRRIPRADI